MESSSKWAKSICGSPIMITINCYARMPPSLRDKLEGRNVGTPGFETASKYVEEQFRKIGLQPAGLNGYRQPVKLDSRTLVSEQTKLALVRGGSAVFPPLTVDENLAVFGYRYEPAERAARIAEVKDAFPWLIERGRQLAEHIRAGTVMVNDVLATHAMAETPWAGVKASGIGVAHSDEGLRHMCEARHVNHDLIPWLSKELWWYPYGAKSYAGFLRLMRWMWGGGWFDRVARWLGR